MPVANNDLQKEIRIIAKKLEEVTDMLNKLDQKIDKDVQDINDEIEAVRTQFTKAMLEVKNELDHELRSLHDKFNGININDTTNTQKSLELSISGIPMIDGENLNSIISKIGSLIAFNDDKSIASTYRLKSTQQTTMNPISNVIVCFATVQSRRFISIKIFCIHQN